MALTAFGLAIRCSGVAGDSLGAPSCDSDTSCSSSQVCVARSCVTKSPFPAGWMAEVVPLLDSGAAIKEITNLDNLGPMPTFNADAVSTVDVTFDYGTGASAANDATVTLSVPSAIPGRPDLSFENHANLGTTAASLKVPAGIRGRAATLVLTPLPPDDERGPPRIFPTIVAPSIPIMIEDDNVALRGKLLTAADEVPLDQFVARLFQGGAVVSSSALVSKSDGSFSLLLPPARTSGELRLQISPRAGSNPSFISDPLTLVANVGTIKLPAYTTPDQFQVIVLGDGAPQEPVAGALVRASTALPQGDPNQPNLGSTVFLRDGITDGLGTAMLSLIPGTVFMQRDYELAVVPPDDSRYATHCFERKVAAGGRANSFATLQAVTLPLRRILSGTVVANDGTPVPNLLVTATTTSVVDGCSTAIRAASGTAKTRADGTFQLPLDPGTYQIDLDPPSGSPVPRLTLAELVTMTATFDVDGSVSLPKAMVAEGRVVRPDTMPPIPLPFATVRIYQPRCSGAVDCFGPERTAPWLRGVAQSDANGRFRVVVPVVP